MTDSAIRYEQAAIAWSQGALARAKSKAKPRPEPGLLARFFDPPDIYGPNDLAAIDFDPVADLGFPGEPPYTRGVQPNMYRGRLWTMRQYAGFGTARESNERYRYLLSQGQSGLSIAFDLPTQMGLDSDSPRACGEVGRVGVAISTIDDMRTLFDGVALDRVSTSMTINATAAVLLCMYIAVAEEKGIPRHALRGTIQNDILKEYVARGTYIFPPRPSLRLMADIFAFCGAEVPKWNTISISGYHMREAGCDAVQEVAFTLANGLEYVRTAVEAGQSIDAFGEQISFFFNAHNNFLEEVAKFRAARRMWSTYMHERFGATSPRARALRFHCQTAGMTLTAQQPHNNAARVAIQALAAVLGGCQSLHTNSFDEALGLPTQQSATVALRTQQIIAHETGVADFVDALGGSYAVESLTHRIEQEARKYIDRIDELGGAVAAIEHGYIQREIQNAAYQYQMDIERKRRVVVGQNEFISDTEPVVLLRVDSSEEQAQCERLRAFRARRSEVSSGLWAQSLQGVERAARGTDNLVFAILDAVKAGATVGEVSDALRSVWGEYTGVSTV